MAYDSVFKKGLFEGKVAIVTGGGSGIGRCIAHELASLGAEVILASRDRTKLEAVQAEIEEDGGRARVIPCNIREEAEVKALFDRALEHHERIDMLVNNGGGQFVSTVENISLKGWRAVIETNLTGTFLMCREAMERSMAKHGGAVVNIVADMWRGMPLMGHSGAARAGVVNLTKTMALEWAQYGVRVNAVAPGVILSSGFKTYPEPVRLAMQQLPKELPARRFGTESEVSGAVVFLLSPGASYISGDTIRVDGASSLYRHAFQIPTGADPTPAYSGFHRSADLPEELAGDS